MSELIPSIARLMNCSIIHITLLNTLFAAHATVHIIFTNVSVNVVDPIVENHPVRVVHTSMMEFFSSFHRLSEFAVTFHHSPLSHVENDSNIAIPPAFIAAHFSNAYAHTASHIPFHLLAIQSRSQSHQSFTASQVRTHWS